MPVVGQGGGVGVALHHQESNIRTKSAKTLEFAVTAAIFTGLVSNAVYSLNNINSNITFREFVEPPLVVTLISTVVQGPIGFIAAIAGSAAGIAIGMYLSS